MKKYLFRILTIISVIMCFAFSMCSTSYAYTEEEKQQAKAWLSAHGYSPDMGGASQAYQDYLNGKFDEELGIDVNGDGIPAPEGTTTQETTEESSTEETKDAKEKLKKKKPGSNKEDDESEKDIGDESGSSTEDSAEMASEILSKNGEETETAENSESAGEQEKTSVSHPVNNAKLSKGVITLYQPGKMDTYKEAGMVIGISLLVVIIIQLLISLRR